MNLRLWRLTCCLWLGGCAAAVPPKAALPLSAEMLRGAMQRAQSPLQAYSADVRLSYFGPQGRLRATASLLVQRPNKLRYELQGPHGGVLLAVASDGQSLTAFDVRQNRLVRGTASAAHFDALLDWVPLHLDATGWVALLFGEIDMPPGAALTQLGDAALWRWQADDLTYEIAVDPATGRLRRARVLRQQEVVSEVRVEAFTGDGLPEQLHLEAPPQAMEVTLRLRDIDPAPHIQGDPFTLLPPAGATIVELAD